MIPIKYVSFPCGHLAENSQIFDLMLGFHSNIRLALVHNLSTSKEDAEVFSGFKNWPVSNGGFCCLSWRTEVPIPSFKESALFWPNFCLSYSLMA